MPVEALQQVCGAPDVNNKSGMIGKLFRHGVELKRDVPLAGAIENDRARGGEEMFWENKGVYATFTAGGR